MKREIPASRAQTDCPATPVFLLSAARASRETQDRVAFQALLERTGPLDSQASPASKDVKESEEIPVPPDLPSPDHREFREPGAMTV